jgi:hypothetical protein
VEAYAPEKLVWTEEDFERMGWHDATLHGIAFLTETFELVLDLDYIFEWVEHSEPEPHFTFWVAPCTLVFENVFDLRIELEPYPEVSVADLTRADPGVPRNADVIGRAADWLWKLECHQGVITFRAAGYTQYVRATPMHGEQSLTHAERGGVAFDRRPHGGDLDRAV